MKKILCLIVIPLTFACFTPIHVDYCCISSDDVQFTSEVIDGCDYSTQRTEQHKLGCVFCEKRIKVNRFTVDTRPTELCTAMNFNVQEFNDTGVLNEVIKRDYSGDEPL